MKLLAYFAPDCVFFPSSLKMSSASGGLRPPYRLPGYRVRPHTPYLGFAPGPYGGLPSPRSRLLWSPKKSLNYTMWRTRTKPNPYHQRTRTEHESKILDALPISSLFNAYQTTRTVTFLICMFLACVNMIIAHAAKLILVVKMTIGNCIGKWKKCSERRKYCALAVLRRSQKKIRPAADLVPGGAGWPKFNQLEMVTTFTYKPSLVNIDTRNFQLSW